MSRNSPRNQRGLSMLFVLTIFGFWLAVVPTAVVSEALLTPKISRTVMYTATSDLTKLIHTESRLIDVLNDYIAQEEENLERLKKYSAKAKENQQLVLDHGIGSAITNPINVFLTLRRIDQWRLQEDLIRNGTDRASFVSLIHSDPETYLGSLLPSDEDLHGAANALFRLQDTYNLKASVLSDGQLMTNLYTETLSALECFELGRIAFDSLRDYYHALIWFKEAWRKLATEQPATVDAREVLHSLAGSLLAQGNVEHAYHMIRKLLKQHPDYASGKESLENLEAHLKSAGKQPNDVPESWSELPEVVNTRPNDGHLEDRDGYEALCRGENQDQSEWSKLTCHYKGDTPYSRLAPFKVEVVRIAEPRVVIFRNIVTDREVEKLKSLAENMFYTTEHMLLYRVSKSAWVGDEEDALVRSLSSRIEQATGLRMDEPSAEKLHLSCYGIGGFYEPHHDYYRYNAEDNATFSNVLRQGNRIATILVYLSTPYIGGSTVFTELKLTLTATKNDAAYWFNLHRNGTANPMTRHAACPVLAGTKWIGNKWVHERGQEFRVPCKLENV